MKPVAIVFCRLSRAPTHGVMSLASQQFSIDQYREKLQIGVHAVLHSVGSAFSKPQTDIMNMLKSCKNKVVIVYEPNRLSRNLDNFNKMWAICSKNKHKIAIVTLDRTFDPCCPGDYEYLAQLITQAQNESREMGMRISRTMQYKKSRETEWGFMRNDRDETVPNPNELKINKLIRLLGTAGSSVREIRDLIEELGTNDVEPFEIIEYEDGVSRDIGTELPYAMDIPNIMETLKIYGVKHRKRSNWKGYEISEILKKIDKKSEKIEEKKQEWICVYYDPKVGLPPHIRIPDGMILPKHACEIYIPK